MNSDGTTKSQKLQAAAINGMVISLNEVPDGCASSMIANISHELHRLREIAHALRLPNDKLNWILIQSSSSDSASSRAKEV